MADQQTGSSDAQPVDAQAAEQTGQQVRLRIDERNMTTSYANAFRTNATAEEVFLDFGVNLLSPVGQSGGRQESAEVVFQTSERVILNYFTAKRLAIALSQMVRRHEERFGELKSNSRTVRSRRSGVGAAWHGDHGCKKHRTHDAC